MSLDQSGPQRASSRFGGTLLSTLLVVPALIVVMYLRTNSESVSDATPEGISNSAAPHERFALIEREILGRFDMAVPRGSVIAKVQAAAERAAPVTKTIEVKQVEGSVAQPSARSLELAVFRVLKKYGKPIPNGKQLAAAIVREALAQEYDPVFVAAVIKSESAFDALARSHKGAQGLMQIMPKTGEWLADKADLPNRKLTDPIHNLKLGISYLKELEAEYHGNRVLTLIAYNWGPGHVRLASSGSRMVPGEVMQYAIKILNDYRRWSTELG